MVTKSFSVKLSRIRNKKDSEYFAYRINIPKTVADELELEDKDRVFCKIQKAEWYHTLDWSTMEKTWDGLPSNIQQQIQEGGLLVGTNLHVHKNAGISAGTSFISQENRTDLQNFQNRGAG